jgi:predicted PurR-regulated permease PerM
MINELITIFLWVSILFAVLLIVITERIYTVIKERNALLKEQNKILKKYLQHINKLKQWKIKY